MEVEINEARRHVLIWLRSDESKESAQPIIDKYRETDYVVALFCSGSRSLQDNILSLLLHNRKKCAETYRTRVGLNQQFNDNQHTES